MDTRTKKVHRIYIPVLLAGFLIIAIVLRVISVSGKPVHYHAGFRVYRNGVLQDYSDPRYMEFRPCNAGTRTASAAETQLEKAHLHDGYGDVVHVHRDGSVWQDVFTNVRITVPANQSVTGYENGSAIPDILSTPIRPYQSVNMYIGEPLEASSASYVSAERIREAEKSSESCGTP